MKIISLKKSQIKFVKINSFRHNHRFLYFSVVSLILFLTMIGIFLINVRFSSNSYTFQEIYEVITTPGWTEKSDSKFSEINATLWNSCATLIGAIGLAIAGVITQSLTKNSLADASTLGISQAAVFGVVAVISFGLVSYAFQFLFVIIGGAIAIGILFLLVSFSKRKITGYKLILAGLAVGIIFKTLTFFFKNGNQFASSINYAYIFGGAETIYRTNFAEPWTVLLISFILIMFGLFIALVNTKSLTVLELGVEKAKELGTKIWLSRLLSVISLIAVTPAAVIIVGNISFIGLFSTHIARYLMQSRNYKYTLTTSILVAAIISSLGFQLTQRVPSINSGLWMTFLGAPYLIYIGIRGLK